MLKRRQRVSAGNRSRPAHTAMIPMLHQGTVWDIANAVLFFASDDSKFVTGVLLPVDGGSTLSLSG